MKKIAMLVLPLALALCACGGKAEGSFSPEAGSAVHAALDIGGTSVSGETAVEDALALLGDGYDYAEAISCVYEGMDKTYTYEDAVVYTYPGEDGDRLMEIYCTGGDVNAGGVGFGASKDDVTKVFGGGYAETGSVLRYENEASAPENEPASLYFEFADGKVTAMGFTAEHRAE